MTMIEREVQRMENRPPAFDPVEQTRRAAMFRHFASINRFEGIVPNDLDERLFNLLATGKITNGEYLQICLAEARGTGE